MKLPDIKSPEAKVFIVIAVATVAVNILWAYIPALPKYA
jgi:hypothetical protein